MWHNKTSEAKPTSSTNKSNNDVSVETTQSIPMATPSFASTPASAATAPAPVKSLPPVDASRVGPGLRFRGELSGTSDLYIDGEMIGSVRLEDSLVVVGPNGRVQADIHAHAILVHGSLTGNLFATERIQLGRESRVGGNLSSKHIQIEDGALFKGHVDMDVRQAAASVRSADKLPASEHSITNDRDAGITTQSGTSAPQSLTAASTPAPVSVAPPTAVTPVALRATRLTGDKAAS